MGVVKVSLRALPAPTRTPDRVSSERHVLGQIYSQRARVELN